MKEKIKRIISKIKNKVSDKKKIKELKKELKTLNDGYDELENNYLILKKQYDEDLLVLTIKGHERSLKYKQDRIDSLRKENKELSKENQEYRKLLNKVGE